MAKKNPGVRKSRKKRDRYNHLVITGIVISILVIGVVLWGPWHKARPEGGKKRPPEIARLGPAKKHGPGEKAGSRTTAKIAIVIDDLGQDLKPARELLALPGKITFSIMPGLSQTRRIAELARQNDREVLLHLPMERKNGNGKREAEGTLRSDMTPSEFIATLNRDIESVPGAAGTNNHEGSALTENAEAMNFLMSELKNHDLFYLDSLTNHGSVAYATAKKFGLKAAKRDVFLDAENTDSAYVRGRLEELARIAKKRGRAVGIGHPYPATINELRLWLAKLDEQGLELVPVSRLVK